MSIHLVLADDHAIVLHGLKRVFDGHPDFEVTACCHDGAEALKAVQDLERLVARAALGTAGPRDLTALSLSLAAIPRVMEILAPCQAPLVTALLAQLDELGDVRERIDRTLVAEPPALHVAVFSSASVAVAV